MKRKIYNKLLDWKHNSCGSTAILVEGARRIGKSYIVEEFARNEYESYILVNFSNASRMVHQWFDDYLEDIDTLLEFLQLHYNKHLTERKSLIIFDEIQDCPRARQAIKPLVADGRFDYIETGSLVSIKKNVNNILIPSEEVCLQMYPMDFEEFLWAIGESHLMNFISKRYYSKTPMGDIHRKVMLHFRQYLIVGGMPQAVNAWVETHDFAKVDEQKRNILQLYAHDIGKYGVGNTTRVKAIFDAIPGQLQKHEKKFTLSSLGKNARRREYEDAFFWLQDAKIVNCCYNSTAPDIGLRLNEDRSKVKCYMADTGLLISHSFDLSAINTSKLYQKLMFDKLEFNRGMLLENVVAQMLVSSGHRLFFYSTSTEDSSERMEIDFLIPKSVITSRHNIIPLEVKSTTRYTLSSLNKCVVKFNEQVTQPTVIHTGDLKEENGILYIPIYMTPLL